MPPRGKGKAPAKPSGAGTKAATPARRPRGGKAKASSATAAGGALPTAAAAGVADAHIDDVLRAVRLLRAAGVGRAPAAAGAGPSAGGPAAGPAAAGAVVPAGRGAADGGRALTLADLNLPGVTKEVRELQAADTARIIEGIFADVVGTILAGDGFSYAVPDRSAANHMYVEALDRIVLKDRVSQRAFSNASTVRKAAITTRVMQLVHQLLQKNIHTSKRDIFYADPNLFSAQEESDAVLNDIACIVGCTRTSLAIVASDKVRADGGVVRCQRPSWCTVFFGSGRGHRVLRL